MSEHYCETMTYALSDGRLPVYYSPRYREWGIEYPDDTSAQLMYFCPWCGRKLPESLREEWSKRAAVLGLDAWSDDIPEPLDSDRWWKEAGL